MDFSASMPKEAIQPKTSSPLAERHFAIRLNKAGARHGGGRNGGGARHGKPPPGARMREAPSKRGSFPARANPTPRHIASLRAPCRFSAPLCFAKRRFVPIRGASFRKEALRGFALAGPSSPRLLGPRPPHHSAWRGFAVSGPRSLLHCPPPCLAPASRAGAGPALQT